MPQDRPTRVFLAHAALYALAVLVLAGINLWLAPQALWVVWVALGWGIGLAAHGLALYLRTARRRERIFIDRKARAFVVHAFAYVAVVLLLLAVNLIKTPQTWWWYWVALGWGAGVAFHAWCALFRKRSGSAAQALPGKQGRRPRVAKPRRRKS